MKPDPSAMPMPSVATSVMPSGGKPMKFFTEFTTRSSRFAGASMFVTAITAPVDGCL